MTLCPLIRTEHGGLDYIPTSRYVSGMGERKRPKRPGLGAREKLLDAAFVLIRQKGYSATSVDELCAQAGVTKGAFFHHFKSKAALAVAAVNRWTEVSKDLFQAAPYQKQRDPLDRVLAYLDFRKALLKGEVAQFSCLVGTMVQEVYGTHSKIREACEASLIGLAAMLEADIAAAMKLYGVPEKCSAQSLALHAQAVLQGAFVLAKATGGSEVAAASIDHLRSYIELLFKADTGRKGRRARPQALCVRSSSKPENSSSCPLDRVPRPSDPIQYSDCPEGASLPGETRKGSDAHATVGPRGH
jgi:TetR/AcrR family transcriptional regulator, transcriptional repressor for nem operon